MNSHIIAFQEARTKAQALATLQDDRVLFARRFVAAMLQSYTSVERGFPVTPVENPLATKMGKIARQMDFDWAAYLIGTTYTVMLPEDFRKKNGVYYTPPALVAHLLNLAEKAGVDWAKAKVVDPACGGGAFIAPVAQRMAQSLAHLTAEARLQHIQEHVRGIEIDTFSAWMSCVFLDEILAEDISAAGKRPEGNIVNNDSLGLSETAYGTFDLVIGNPPYGRIRLAKEERKKWERSLYGHANLYGLFSDLAVRLATPEGAIAYVTPASFLGGQYFKSLRQLLINEAPPVHIDFISQRGGVFEGALQETLLAVYKKGAKAREVQVSSLEAQETESLQAIVNGNYPLPGEPGLPWVLPRTPKQAMVARAHAEMPYRLSDLGYKVSTGPLVWNRHKDRLFSERSDSFVPLIWAECVNQAAQGQFTFKTTGRNHVPWYKPYRDGDPNVVNRACVLLQRTTSIEQKRRLLAAELPQSFIDENGGGVAVENHLNMVRTISQGVVKVSPSVIARLLNSLVVDQLFRCVSGSTAVSAYELESLPFPSPEECLVVERMLNNNASSESIERYIEGLYKNERLRTAA